MQVFLHTDNHTQGSLPMSEHLSTVVLDALKRFSERVTRVEAHLSDVNGAARTGADDIQCTLHARLIGAQEIVVKDQAPTAHQAIDGAVKKLKRAVGVAAAKQDPRRPRRSPAVAAVDAEAPSVDDTVIGTATHR